VEEIRHFPDAPYGFTIQHGTIFVEGAILPAHHPRSILKLYACIVYSVNRGNGVNMAEKMPSFESPALEYEEEGMCNEERETIHIPFYFAGSQPPGAAMIFPL